MRQLYLAALSTVDPELYDAAIIDGAGRFQRVIHIDIPGIMPTIVITLILAVSVLLGTSTEKILLMQNPLNYRISENIGTYVYKVGVTQSQFSFATAVGLFNSVVSFILLYSVNAVIRRINETSLFTEWLKNVNLPMPTTTEEFKKVLQAFKTQDPNKNGKADEWPLAGASSMNGGWHTDVYRYLLNALGYFDDYSDWVRLEGNKLIPFQNFSFWNSLNYSRYNISTGRRHERLCRTSR
jgi:ABC-type maltose transport system permease subunit